MDWSPFEKNVKASGNSRRERELNKARHYLNKYGENNPSYKKVKINGVDDVLAINTGTQPYYKKFHTLPDHHIQTGDYVEWADTVWLVKTADFDDELIIDGVLQQCNYVLKWQDENLNIIERYAVTQGATAYNTGLNETQLITVGYNQLLVLIPFDEDTKSLTRGHRFFVSNTLKDIRPYKITSFDTTTNIYNGHGYISMMLSEDQLQKDDNVELQICNYHEKENIDITENTRSEISYKSTKIKSGYKKGTTFTANFYNGKNLVNDISPRWELKCNFRDELKIVEDGNKITISVDNDELINQHLSLILSDTEGNYTADELLLEVIGLF